MEEEVGKYGMHVERLIKEKYGRNHEKGMDANDFHKWLTEEMVKFSEQNFKETDRCIKEEVIEPMLTQL